MSFKTKLAGLRAIRKFDNWVQVAVNRTFFPDTGCIVYRQGDIEVIVDHLGGDANGVRECLTSNMYKGLIASISEKDGRVQNILDIGANGGGFTLLAYLMGVPLRNVVCVEMNPRVFGRLAFNLYQNLHGASINLIHGAIAASSGSIEVSFGRGSTGDTLNGASLVPGNVDRIELLSLDDIVNRAFSDNTIIDLCKIDVEGAEYEVFLGTECTLVRRFRYLIMEIHELVGQSREGLIMRLHDLGFDDISPEARPEKAVFLFQNRTLRVS